MRNRTLLIMTAAFVLMLALAACGGGGDTAATSDIGDVNAGKTLYAQQIIGAQPGCITCHSLEPDTVVVGPSMAGIASRAGDRVAGQSAEEYIRTSILHPDDYVVEGFAPGVMVQVWEDELTEEQVDNLVAYLLTLE